MFSSEFSENFKNIFFTEHLWTTEVVSDEKKLYKKGLNIYTMMLVTPWIITIYMIIKK